MSMSSTSHAASSSGVVITAAAEPPPEKGCCDHHAALRRAPPVDVVDSLLNLDRNVDHVDVVKTEVQTDQVQTEETVQNGEEYFGSGGEIGERILSREKISRHRREDDAWIVVDGKVYEVTNILDIHPGGPELILNYLALNDNAGNAGLLMRGKVDEDGHSHSKAAFQMLQQFLVGSVEEQPDGYVREHIMHGMCFGDSHVDMYMILLVTESCSAHLDLAVEQHFEFSRSLLDAASVHINFLTQFHLNTKSAKKKYRYDVDLAKPIVCQVGYLGLDYDDWVHDPVISRDTPRLFESDFCEFFTRTKWWVIPMLWVPVATAMIYTAVVKERVPISRLPILAAGGILLWSCLEYLVHLSLHTKTSSFWGNTIHYVLHGCHHKHPMDGSRLVFPPLVVVPSLMLVWTALGSWAAEYPNKLVIVAVGLINYVIYDLTHYFLHFGTAFNSHTRQLKRYHLNHHFKDPTMGFGVTCTVWDRVFGTKPSMD
ncbi:unnamed protein product [Calypogeia fissa]